VADDDVLSMIRGGGLVTVLVGALLLAVSIYIASRYGGIMWVALGMPALAVIGIGLLGARQNRHARVVQHMPLEALRKLVQTQELGFTVCVRCRVVMPGNLLGSCTECLSPVECVTVETERERKTALAAIPET
jgi:hypothetical protein